MEKDFVIEIGGVLNYSEVPNSQFSNYHYDKGKMYSKSLRYDWQTGKILLPNNWKFIIENLKKEAIDRMLTMGINQLQYDLSHEIMHKWLRENISDDACGLWENIDKIIGSKEYRFSNPDSPCFFESFSNVVNFLN